MNNEEKLALSALELISQILDKNLLPDDMLFLEKLQGDNGSFQEQESVLHDYKAEYPHSNSDAYFGGILRLVCALHNTYGGLILFGISDETRLAGKNKVIVDPEKINRKLRESLTSTVNVSFKSYNTSAGRVDVLLVPKRQIGIPPIRLSQGIGNYSSKKIFLRRGAEVLDAKGSDLEYLYGNRSNPIMQSNEFHTYAEAALPASPATLAEFVGRFSVIEDLWNWLVRTRDSRFFLWGAGGSGKSTIAYEFARIVASVGRMTQMKSGKNSGKTIDRVIYLTAKKIYLDPFNAKIEKFRGTDFENARELFRSILELSHYTTKDLSNADEDELVSCLEELFEIETQLIVIDDIDTLVTSNQDLGMEQLFEIIARCSSGTKVLYTQRNLPSYARKTAIEVPGLDLDTEFRTFCKLCADQFKVPTPTEEEAKSIAKLSEIRPLAIETIIGLRRITNDYGQAMARWNSDSSDAREYLFQREYERLSTQSRGKNLLAALAVLHKPQQLDVLKAILLFSDEQMQDAVAETRDIFLRVEHNSNNEGDLYFLGAATHSFISKVSVKLDYYSQIQARVSNFTSRTISTPPAVVTLTGRAERNIEQGEIETAIALLTNPELPAVVIEHPAYKAVLGAAYSKLPNPRLAEARILFREASVLGHTEYKMYTNWLSMEDNAGSGKTLGIEVCQLVTAGKGFPAKTLAIFHLRLAGLQVARAMEISASAPNESAALWKGATLSNTRAHLIARSAHLELASSTFERFTHSLEKFCNYAVRSGLIDDFFFVIEAILNMDFDLTDCLSDVGRSVVFFSTRQTNPQDIVSVRKNLNRLSGHFSKREFCSAEATARMALQTKFRDLITALKSG
jgi:hypothetical protein